MYKQLNTLLRKPALYEKTVHPFWDDSHISAGMLHAHLNPLTDAASRMPRSVDRAAAWIGELVPRGAALLDLGCGPGLYTKRFAQQGMQVTGVDISPRSIAWAREHDAQSSYLVLNYLEMGFENAFDIITLIWCNYGALIPQDRHHLLRRIHQALKPNGLFVLDIFTPNRYKGFQESTTWERHEGAGFWSPQPHILLTQHHCYDGNIGLSRYVVVADGSVRDYNIWDTTFTPASLSDEMAPHGLTPLAFHADMAGNAYDPHADIFCAVMVKSSPNRGTG